MAAVMVLRMVFRRREMAHTHQVSHESVDVVGSKVVLSGPDQPIRA